MAFSPLNNPELLAEVFGLIRKSRYSAEAQADERRMQLKLISSEFAAIDSELHETGSAIYNILSSGNNIKEKMESLAQRNLELQEKRNRFLKDNDLPENYLSPVYGCSMCNDSGYINGEYCHCVHDLYKRLNAKKINEASPLRLSNFDTYDIYLVPEEGNARRHMSDVLSYLKDYVAQFSEKSKNLYFYGPTGLGKTHLSLAIANTVASTGKNVIYCSAPSIFQQIADERFERIPMEGTERSLIECDLLVIDDLGAEMITQLSQSILYNIINSRLLRNRPTIISSNIDIDKLDNYYHERTVSRIAFSFDIVPFIGRDMRQIKKRLENS